MELATAIPTPTPTRHPRHSEKGTRDCGKTSSLVDACFEKAAAIVAARTGS